jgi:restriction endonuclease S subunit
MAEPKLKPNRQLYRFDQLATNVNDRVEPGDTDLAHYVGLEHLDSDSLKIRRWGKPEDVEATKLRFRQGDIIFGRRRVYQRKLAVADFDGICSAHAMVLRPKPEVVLPEFLPFFMQSDLFMNRALEISVGSLSPTINWRTLAAQEFPLPPPDEQRRLVEVLSSLDTTLFGLTECVQSGKTLAESAFRHMFEEDSYVKSCALDQVSIRITNGFVGSAAAHYVTRGIPYLRSTNIRRHRIDKSELVYVSEEFHQKNTKSQLMEGDLLTVQSGHVGETAVVTPVEAGWNCHALIITRLDRSVVEPEYVSLYLNSLYGRRDIARYLIGSTVMHINTSDLAKMKIPLPSMKRQKYVLAHGRQLLSQVELLQRRFNIASDFRRSLIEFLL